MKIIEKYSHLNGLEFLLVHKPMLWREIQEVINEVDAEKCKIEVLKEKTKQDQVVYSPADISMACKKLLEEKGWAESKINYWQQNDFIKERVATEVQFGKCSLATHDLFASHLAFYAGDKIDVGIEILPMEKFQTKMASGVSNYEGVFYNFIRQGRGVPAVPLVIIGIEP
jgi:hypothetical protein